MLIVLFGDLRSEVLVFLISPLLRILRCPTPLLRQDQHSLVPNPFPRPFAFDADLPTDDAPRGRSPETEVPGVSSSDSGQGGQYARLGLFDEFIFEIERFEKKKKK